MDCAFITIHSVVQLRELNIIYINKIFCQEIIQNRSSYRIYLKLNTNSFKYIVESFLGQGEERNALQLAHWINMLPEKLLNILCLYSDSLNERNTRYNTNEYIYT